MLELPEVQVVADQLARTVIGKHVAGVVAGKSPHRFAFFSGDPGEYDEALRGKEVVGAYAIGGFVEVRFGDTSLILNDGANVRYHPPDGALPGKHQLLVVFLDGSAVTVTVQMYAGLMCVPTGSFHNPYYSAATSKPSPLTDAFDAEWLRGLLAPPEVQKLSPEGGPGHRAADPGLRQRGAAGRAVEGQHASPPPGVDVGRCRGRRAVVGRHGTAQGDGRTGRA